MNENIKRIGGTSVSLVYVGGKPLLKFHTDQEAWEYLTGVSKDMDKRGEAWLDETYIVFVVEESGDTILIPQLQKIVKKDRKLALQNLFGDNWVKFRQQVVDDWPNVKRGFKYE